jgi:sulfide:quinone oxidoreductase
MNIRTLTNDFSVSSQILPSDLPQLKAKGFLAIICNRPDHEEPGQPSFAEVAAAAAAVGIEARHVPVRPDAISANDVAAFGRAIKELPGPVLGYCRSGGRSAAMWEKSRA